MPRATDPQPSRPRKRRRTTPRPKAPAPVQRGHASEGGRTITPRNRRPLPAAPVPNAFRPLPQKPGATRPLEQVRRRQRNQTAKARGRLPAHPDIPRIPLKRSYTTREKRAITAAYRTAQERAGVSSFRELYALGNRRQRAQMRRVGMAISRQTGPNTVSSARAKDPDLGPGTGTPGKVQAAGINFDLRIPGQEKRTVTGLARDIGRVASPLPIPGTVAGELTRATLEDPAAVVKTSIRTGIESVAGLPQGVKAMVQHPGEALKAIAKDYEDRYGSIFNDPAKFREAVKSEYGLTPYLFDAASAAAIEGRAIGLAARTAPARRAAAALQKGNKAQKAFADLITATDRDRPGLRFSGGEEGVKRQGTSRNIFKAIGQHELDRQRRKAWLGTVGRAGLREAEGGRLVRAPKDAQGRRQLGRLPALRPGEGEVSTPSSGLRARSFRDLPGLRKYTGRVARDIGGAQSVMRLRMLTRRGRVMQTVEKAMRRLDEDESRALNYMVRLGATPDAAGIRVLEQRLAQINRAREEKGAEITPILENTNDEARLIREILSDPEDFLTPRTREVADELREIQLREAANDPALAPDQELIRRYTQQGAALGVTRGPDVDFFQGVVRDIEKGTETPGLATYAERLASVHPSERPQIAQDMLDELTGQERKAGRDVDTALRRRDVMRRLIREREQRGVPLTTRELTEARRDLAKARQDLDRVRGELRGRREEHQPVRGVKSGGDFRIQDTKAALAPLERRVREARRNLRAVEERAPRVTPGQFAKAQRTELELAAARETRDSVEGFRKAFGKVVAATRRKDTMRLEDAQSFVGKVRAAADEAGLAEPAYWMSSIRPENMTSLAAVGKGLRAADANKGYRGRVFEIGAEETDPGVFTRGVERNIKRRFQWELVHRNLERHAFEWSRGRNGEGLTPTEIKKLMDERHIAPESIELIDPRIVQKGTPDETGLHRGSVLDEEELQGLSEQDFDRAMMRDMSDTRRPWDPSLLQGQAMNRYLVVPREVGETLDGLAQSMDSAFWRGWEIALKQKPARILLGAANIPWLGFQIASNGLLTGLGGGVNPFNVHGAWKFWKGLDQEAKDALEAELGITRGHGQHLDQTNLGSVHKDGMFGHMVAAWRGFKQTKTMRVGHRINPLNVMFRADEIQNNFFRRVLFYDAARKQAYRRMGSSWRGIDKGVSRLMDRVLAQPPDRQLALIARHGEDFEKVAKHVNDFLGDYLRFTPSERFLLSRNIMFYGYLRFSLRFTFFTMPVGHPVMTNIMGNIGRLGAQETKELFGVPSDYQLPTSMIAAAYFGDRQDAKAGKLRSLPLGRFNPFLNTVTQLDGAQQAFGLVSPIYQALMDQAFEESTFTGRDWRIGGEPLPGDTDRPKNYYGNTLNLLNPAAYAIPGVSEGKPRNRILERDLLNLFPPYRFAEQAILSPSQSDDALAWSPRPIQYSDQGDAAEPVARARRRFEKRPFADRLLPRIFPVSPQETQAPAVIEQERERQADLANRRLPESKRKRTRRKRSSSRYGGGSSSSRYGG